MRDREQQADNVGGETKGWRDALMFDSYFVVVDIDKCLNDLL